MAKSIRPNRRPGPFTVEDATQLQIQQEIERQADKGRVVLACGLSELDLFIDALEQMPGAKAKEVCDSLKQLREGAFGK